MDNNTSEEYCKVLEERDKALEERDKALEERDKALEERDKTLEERDKALEERDKALEELVAGAVGPKTRLAIESYLESPTLKIPAEDEKCKEELLSKGMLF